MKRWFTSGLAVALALGASSCGDKHKATVDQLRQAGYQHTTADWMRAAASDDAVALGEFVKAGMDVLTRDANGDTALHAAAEHGALQSANFLLDRKVAVDVRGANDRTPLMAAAQAGQGKAVAWLLKQGADPALKDKDDYMALMVAVREDQPRPIAELAMRSREKLDDALLLAALMGRSKAIDALTSYGASVYARTDDGRTPLMLAAENGQKDAAKLLMQIGANRSATDNEGRNASALAREASHPEIADLLDRGPVAEDLVLETPQEIGQKMNQWVDAARAESEGVDGPSGAVATKSQGAAKSSAVASIEGQQIAIKAVAAGQAASQDDAGFPALIMRHYRQRELPVMVKHVDGKRAQLVIGNNRQVAVDEGGPVPGTRLKIVKVQERVRDSKLNGGQDEEVSVVEVEDTQNASRRRLVMSVPSTAHDPMALVEDATTGQRYLAAPGQRFRGSDGGEFVVTDVRPDQIVIENAATHATLTQPLRGPRG